MNVPESIYSERIKLNEVEFKSEHLVLEWAKARYKDYTQDKQNSPDHQFKNYYLKYYASIWATAWTTASTATTTKITT